MSLPEDKYRIINDLLIKSGDYSTQIDHVIISIYGIFVIETKNLQGWIYGGKNSEFWTQNIYGRKYKLRNPLWQNEGHIKAIRREIREYGKLPFFSIIAFSKKVELMLDESLPVMNWNKVVTYIEGFTKPVISEAEVRRIYETLSSANVKDPDARKEHVSNVRSSIVRRNQSVSNGICPLCGGKLVQRYSKYGNFYGCSNYPNCKYTTM